MRQRLPFILFLLFLLPSLNGCGYNSMQQNEEAVFAAWGNLEAALQRRADLIPNLVETVKGFATQERETLEAVVEARSKASSIQLSPEALSNPQALANFQAAQGELSSALSRLMVVVERYPDLKSNQNFLALQHQLEGTENRINVARQRYNEAVQTFNYSIRKFPNSMTNSLLLDLERKEFFQADDAARQVPQVDFGAGE
ncbi:LemA protein [Paucidesulfovibrio gracilis DSM 16080]|uniref:LemA protein n=1 Tax=Paucidesulfovibrio gracilis DSM 16080 TaxID=1121449 RepID=A0A1T4WIE9_9BACT|nr:LemA family protein [Paucidesulfovibrio gracilis]SKA76939.1 LemA protein [Paucidesulfovibrio gracilis DSM 16080]